MQFLVYSQSVTLVRGHEMFKIEEFYVYFNQQIH